MKTEITKIFKPRDGYRIFRVLILNNGTIAILNWKPKETSIFDFYHNGQLIKTIFLEDIPELDKTNYAQCVFKYKEGFGFLNKTNTLVIWQDINLPPKIINISNPFPVDLHNRFYNPKFGYYDQNSNELWFGLEEPIRYGFSPRYLCKLEITNNNILGNLESEQKAIWGRLIELPLSAFPETYNSKYPEIEWLGINTFKPINNNLFVYSVGGTATRLKSGPNFEFSKIGILNPSNLETETFTVEEGHGIFAENSDYFILHSRLKKNKLFFYNIKEQNIAFDISLTATQNLGNEKKNYLLFDFDGRNLYLYNTEFLHVCQVLNN